MKYKAVIFDLDGTLLDTITDIAISVNNALKKYNYPTYKIDEYKYFAGRGIDKMISTIIKEGNINPAEFEKIKNSYIQEYKNRANAGTKIFPGIVDLLKNLKKIGVSINILSNKPHFQVEDVVREYFDISDFDQVYGKKPNFNTKPDPSSVLDLISKLGVDKEEVLYIGDTNTDIQTANFANLVSVGVLWGFREKKELLDAGANYIVEHPMKIFDIVVGKIL